MIAKALFVPLFLVTVASADSKVSFSAQKDLPIDAMPALMIPVDLDKDGDVDVLVHAMYGEFEWLDNQGNGKFTKRVIDAKFETGGLAGYVTYGDVDGDKDLDVIASSDNGTTGWEIQVLENVGGKAFSANAVAPKVATKAYYAVDGADLDGDKDIDIVVTGGLKTSWWENLGSNKFTEHDIKTYEQTMSGAAFAVDLNRDGKPDFLSKRWGDGATFVWYQNGAEAAATGSPTKGGSTKPPKKKPGKH